MKEHKNAKFHKDGSREAASPLEIMSQLQEAYLKNKNKFDKPKKLTPNKPFVHPDDR